MYIFIGYYNRVGYCKHIISISKPIISVKQKTQDKLNICQL